MCAAPCGWFNAFLLSFQIEESEGTFATTVTRGSMELTGGMPSFMDGNSHRFVVVEDNDKNAWARCNLCPSIMIVQRFIIYS